jgi:CheY-like chemotaxis protein/two-component sensor histidine kinase
LNNLLILAQMLAENADQNLTPKQVKYAETIHSSGTDLLALINDILDLSKIESGKMDVEVGSVRFEDLSDYCSRTFRHVAENKGLDFIIDLDQNLPADSVVTDAKRLQQVLKNLLSNAIKFTEHGSVHLHLAKASGGWSVNHPVLSRVRSVIAFSVTDTGIGIPQEKQRIVFEAFQQADGTTSRRYGGTGLGLSISRELARLLGGEIRLKSAPGVGSTFTLYLPQTYIATLAAQRIDAQIRPSQPSEAPVPESPREVKVAAADAAASIAEDFPVEDDRHLIQSGDPVLLIVEDDTTFARILLDLAHDRGLKALIAPRGDTALSLAREFQPGAITLDIGLPDMVGWTILDRLKHDPTSRHIPIHIISGDENRRRGLALGAMTYLEKALTMDSLVEAFGTVCNSLHRRVKRLLVVSSDESQRRKMRQTIGGPDVEIIEAASPQEAQERTAEQRPDAMVVDLGLSEASLIKIIQMQSEGGQPLPMILHSKRKTTRQELPNLKTLARTGVVRRTQTPERLLDETVLLLHRTEADLSEEQRLMLAGLRGDDGALANKLVLVVDDDIRNIFALTSVLEQHKLQVIHAENGRAGIEALRTTPGVDAVLMDIMMPEMDGYETIRAIRQIPAFEALPIIAVTAKAMKGDRAKCIEAGASDYITKPVDLDQLFSVLRVWMDSGRETSQSAGA